MTYYGATCSTVLKGKCSLLNSDSGTDFPDGTAKQSQGTPYMHILITASVKFSVLLCSMTCTSVYARGCLSYYTETS